MRLDFINFRYQSTYKAFNYLLSKQCEDEIDKFLRKDRSLSEYRKKIDYLKLLYSQISVLPLEVPMNLFWIDCSKLNEVNSSLL